MKGGSRMTIIKKLLPLTVVLMMVALACGQKPGVHVATGGSQVLSAEEAAELGLQVDPETGEALSLGGDGSGSEGGTTSRTVDTGGGGGGGAPAANIFRPGPNDKNGVTDTTIKIGFHAPLTGAAAVPLADISLGVNLYRDWLNNKGIRIHGRQTQTIFKDDQYNPSHAVEVCRDMVENDKVFMLIGGAGTDQIIACARYARSRGVPYLSAGVSELIVKDIQEYFAFSMSYPAQTKMLAQVIMKYNDPQRGGKAYINRCADNAVDYTADCTENEGGTPRVGIVYSDTEGFFDARDAFARNFKAASGRDVFKTYPITKFEMSDTEADTLIQRMKSDGIDVVFILTSPTNWLAILQSAGDQDYAPRWTGVGLTKGVNLVAIPSCASSARRVSFQHSLFLNPWMSVYNTKYNPQFREAWNQCAGCPGTPEEHDIAFGLWGGSIVQHALLQAAGRDLGRAHFMNVAKVAKNVRAPDQAAGLNIIDIYSVLNFAPGDNFGANQAHLLWGDCSGQPGRWSDVPGAQFISSF